MPTNHAPNRKIKSVLQDMFGLNDDEMTDDSLLRDDLKLDELDIVELVMALEEEFDIKAEDPEADNWKTVKDVVRFIEINS